MVLVLDEAPAPLLEELRAFAAGAGPVREVTAPAAGVPVADALAGHCTEVGELILWPRLGRQHYASNTPDRNALFIYETAVVVGIPVTLVSAAVWKWYAETVVQGELLALRCGAPPERLLRESYRLRSEGRGFIRSQPLRDAQSSAAIRAVTRQLLAQLERAPPPAGETK